MILIFYLIMKFLILIITFILMNSIPAIHGGIMGILGYGACQSVCNAGYVACLGSLGLTAGWNYL